jgi:SAM-dependent methyltransferase
MADLESFKQDQQEVWGSGNPVRFATTIVIVSELLCEAVDLRAGQRVLDVATGTGNTALAAARRNCEVVGIDYVPSLLEKARERARVEGLTVEFRRGDSERIPYPDASFDAVLSTFGVMFAPDQQRSAAELLRVCRRGGKIGITSFTPDSLAAQFSIVTARRVSPPRTVRPPVLWGMEDHVRGLFGDEVVDLTTSRRSVVLRFRSAGALVDFFRQNFGPMRHAFEALPDGDQDLLREDLIRVTRRFDTSGDGSAVVPFAYLEVVGVRR